MYTGISGHLFLYGLILLLEKLVETYKLTLHWTKYVFRIVTHFSDQGGVYDIWAICAWMIPFRLSKFLSQLTIHPLLLTLLSSLVRLEHYAYAFVYVGMKGLNREHVCTLCVGIIIVNVPSFQLYMYIHVTNLYFLPQRYSWCCPVSNSMAETNQQKLNLWFAQLVCQNIN